MLLCLTAVLHFSGAKFSTDVLKLYYYLIVVHLVPAATTTSTRERTAVDLRLYQYQAGAPLALSGGRGRDAADPPPSANVYMKITTHRKGAGGA